MSQLQRFHVLIPLRITLLPYPHVVRSFGAIRHRGAMRLRLLSTPLTLFQSEIVLYIGSYAVVRFLSDLTTQ